MIGKLACGLWLARVVIPALPLLRLHIKVPAALKSSCWPWKAKTRPGKAKKVEGPTTRNVGSSHQRPPETEGPEKEGVPGNQSQAGALADESHMDSSCAAQGSNQQNSSYASSANRSSFPTKPKSLYPPAILAFSMVARGEIGFLISAVAQSNGIFDTHGSGSPAEQSDSEIFLLATSAIVLCTLIGPLCVGALVRRVKKLGRDSLLRDGGRIEGRKDILSVWGVS